MNFEFDGKKYTVNPDKTYLCGTPGINSRGFTQLMYLVIKLNNIKDDGKFEKFIEQNRDQLDKQNELGYTALILACATNFNDNKKNIINTLIKAGCNLNIQNKGGQSALDITALRNIGTSHPISILKLLIESGIDVNLRDCNEKTTFMRACKYCHKDVILTLMESPNINLNTKDKNGYTILMQLLCNNVINDIERTIIMELLIKKGTDVNIKNNNSENILGMTFCLKQGSVRENIFKLLLDSNIDLQARDCDNFSGFEYICAAESEENIKYCFSKHKYYSGNDLIKCIKITKHKILLTSILEKLFLEIEDELKAY